MTISLSPISRNAATRNFSTSGGARASILFQLAALSNARETQHFNKRSKLDRYEHSPNLKLIKTSEIDPYPVPTSNVEKFLQNGTTPVSSSSSSSSTAKPAFKKSHNVVVPAWDSKALAAGRAILADSARQRSQVARVVRRLRRRESRGTRILQEKLEALAKERQRMREETRSAGFLILLSVATATGFAAWTFWPTKSVVVDSAADAADDAGRQIMEQANDVAITPVYSPAGTSSTNASVATGLDRGVSTTAATKGPDTAVPTSLLPKERATVQPAPISWSWRNLFWKHQ
ncbi:uncharacterized protein SEPMUDRAFT_135214 [Sphaerulina musiva SO2202]|uniref:Uncharacterized protein n=1 Tax=Sphaerulina musiva (strain SO2202) TaxID=692275 RepID=M3AUL5_SPHMS|nr:uncharacterized protein SEPMUDRAFT_135214 [Sphaerulina musiva SO2202]EMF09766.1 hypothetical protein SEPMUDRAFT_135214 [Sphaerulina musiva SO2202]